MGGLTGLCEDCLNHMEEIDPDIGGDETCYECGGDGGYHDCGEDCCNCLWPEINRLCDVCGGHGVLII